MLNYYNTIIKVLYFQNGNRKGGSYMPSPGNDPGNVDESKLRSIISQIIKEELKK